MITPSIRWCGVQHGHVAHLYPEPSTRLGITLSCPGSTGSQDATVTVRLDGLADKIAARVSQGLRDCDDEWANHGEPKHVAAAVVALLQSLAVQ